MSRFTETAFTRQFKQDCEKLLARVGAGVPAPVCHCGKDGHALNSINCPVHGRHEKTAAAAPCHYGPQEAEAWASGYNKAIEDMS